MAYKSSDFEVLALVKQEPLCSSKNLQKYVLLPLLHFFREICSFQIWLQLLDGFVFVFEDAEYLLLAVLART